MINRRKMLMSTLAAGLGTTAGLAYFGSGTKKAWSESKTAGAKGFEIVRTEAEWKKILTPDQFAVLRKHGTEKAGTSPLLNEKRAGTYNCAGCDLPLYKSEDKYDSGTGWPSFIRSIENAIGTKEDNTLFVTRTEAHCRRCGGHLGHIFDDGPKPTGMRHCINGLALTFRKTA